MEKINQGKETSVKRWEGLFPQKGQEGPHWVEGPHSRGPPRGEGVRHGEAGSRRRERNARALSPQRRGQIQGTQGAKAAGAE